MNPNSVPIYSFPEVMDRLKPQFKHTINQLNKLDDEACPKDFAVAAITLHLSYIANGHLPRTLFREMSVRSIGSKGVDVLPDRWTRVGEPVTSPTTKIFVAGKRDRLTEFSQEMDNFSEQTRGAADLFRIWSVSKPDITEKIKQNAEGLEGFWEVGLQLIPLGNNDFIKSAFVSYAQELGFIVKYNMAIEVGSLWFMPVAGDERNLNRLATFAFLRVVRPLPSLRSFPPLTRGVPVGTDIVLPDVQPYASDVRVAILDGGLPEKHVLERWVGNYSRADNSADDHPDGPPHALGVTSACSLARSGLGRQPAGHTRTSTTTVFSITTPMVKNNMSFIAL